MKLILSISIFLTGALCFAATPSLKIAVADQFIGHIYQSSNPSKKRSYEGLNLEEGFFARRCYEPKFTLDKATNTMRSERSWEILGISTYGPLYIKYDVSIQKDSGTHYVIRTRIENNGVVVTASNFVEVGTPMLATTYGTTFETKLNDRSQRADMASVTPVLTMATCN